MAEVIRGRYTAQMDEPYVVFLIGMRINRWRAIRTWVPFALKMGPMLRELRRSPEKGLLGFHGHFNPRGAMLVQYWRSWEDLERFARDPDDPHLPAWRWFNRAVGSDGTVGIWHETFVVQAGQSEAIYGNMPVYGLAAATEAVPAAGRRETAARRLGYDSEPAVPSPPEPTSP